jgi:hypothetical protein
LQNPPKFTKIGIFGLKICHLAILQCSHFSPVRQTRDRACCHKCCRSRRLRATQFQVKNILKICPIWSPWFSVPELRNWAFVLS